MKTLILKLGATGDVVRTTTLLRCLEGSVTWVTHAANRELLEEIPADIRVVTWEQRGELDGQSFDLAVSLEDDREVGALLSRLHVGRLFGSYVNDTGEVRYTREASAWFDMSLVSVYGRAHANVLKFQNRRSYQDLIFSGLGYTFRGEEYLLPRTPESELRGDVAIAPEAGPVWPMKKWDHYGELKAELEELGLVVNYLPTRPGLLDHLADIRGHRCVVSGDSLPMHFAIGSGIPSVALFNCTSPWEIHDYGLLTKLISPLLGEFLYSRTVDVRATRAISLDLAIAAVTGAVEKTRGV